VSEIGEAFNRSFHHPEFWERFAIVSIGLLLMMRGRAFIWRRVLGSRISPWLEGVQTVAVWPLLTVCLVDWGVLLKMSAVLIGGMIWATWDTWREQRAKVRYKARDDSSGPADVV
jgi:hypothetical protein